MREVLYTMEDKETVVAKMYDSLKEGEAYLVITGFLFDEDAESERYSEMIRGWAGYFNEKQPCFTRRSGKGHGR